MRRSYKHRRVMERPGGFLGQRVSDQRAVAELLPCSGVCERCSDRLRQVLERPEGLLLPRAVHQDEKTAAELLKVFRGALRCRYRVRRVLE